MFIDKVKIYVEGGTGGQGCMSFRREKYVPFGGPDGGNGGKGGDVYLKADISMSTLYDFTIKPHYKAGNGGNGRGSNMNGKQGDDKILKVPCGTVVYKLVYSNNDKMPERQLLSDLKKDGDCVLVARGGSGGRGNASFKTSKNTAPRIAELGERGEKVVLELELKLIADVGIIGLPNAGKSTLLSVISNAQPKIAPYPFTTLTPNLGVTNYGDAKIVFADIPGLVQDAHKGKGLGIDFLRHIERTKVLVHMIDVSDLSYKQIEHNFKLIMNEIESYSEQLSKKPMIVALNKIDLIDEKDVIKIKQMFNKKFKSKYIIMPISAATKKNIDNLLKVTLKLLNEYCIDNEKNLADENRVSEYKYNPDIKIHKVKGKYFIYSTDIEKFVSKTNFNYEESLTRLNKIFKKFNIEKLLKKNGIKNGDKVIIAGQEFNYWE